MVCNDAVENLFQFSIGQKEIFPKISDYILAFIQNLLANIMRINLTFTTILKESTKDPNNATDPKNDTLIWYLAGTII